MKEEQEKGESRRKKEKGEIKWRRKVEEAIRGRMCKEEEEELEQRGIAIGREN